MKTENGIVKEIRDMEWEEAFLLFNDRFEEKKENGFKKYSSLTREMTIKVLIKNKFNAIKSVIDFEHEDWFYHSTTNPMGAIITYEKLIKTQPDQGETDYLKKHKFNKLFLSKEPDFFLRMATVRNYNANLTNEVFTFILDLRGIECKKFVHYYDLNDKRVFEEAEKDHDEELLKLVQHITFPRNVDDEEIKQYLLQNNFYPMSGVEYFIEQEIHGDRIRGFFYMDDLNLNEFYWHNTNGTLTQICFH